jgi:D-glycero-alpha-D-manno-heptose-7-phosphate kinase
VRQAVLRARAPVRIDLAGGWTDVPPFSAEVGGAVVSAAINRFTYVTMIPHVGEQIEIESADFDRYLEVKSFRDIEYDGNLDLIKAAIHRLGIQQGMHLYVRCDAPPGSGTGSSASISVALIGLLNRLQDDKLSAHEIARLAHYLEVEELHIAGGKQDQYAAAIGGISFMEFEDPAVNVSALKLPPDTLCELEKRLVLCYTGKSRVSGDIIDTVMGAYRQRVPTTVEALHRLKAIAREMKSALLAGDLALFGELLGENWECQKRLDRSVTNSDIETLFEAARANGAISGKATGAGGGGCIVFYARPDQEHILRRALEEHAAQIIDFNFDVTGLITWVAPQEDE